jgi:hypothetical protein
MRKASRVLACAGTAAKTPGEANWASGTVRGAMPVALTKAKPIATAKINARASIIRPSSDDFAHHDMVRRRNEEKGDAISIRT